MIIRRLVESLRQQHWTGVFIELVIVVLGVFIGLQVSNWNEARRERNLERQYLERLREDFDRSAKAAEGGVEFMENQARKATLVIDSLQPCRLEEGERAAFGSALNLLGRIEPPLMTRGTIDELGSTGRLGIIRSVGLRRALSDVVQEQERTTQVLGFIVARRSAPQWYVDARKTSLVSEDSGSGKPRGPDVAFDFPALCRDPTFINAVSHLRQLSTVVAGQNRRLLKQHRDMVALLDAELAKGRP